MSIVLGLSLVFFFIIVACFIYALVKMATQPDGESLKDIEFDRYSVYINDEFDNYAHIDVDTIEQARNAVVMARAKGNTAYIFDNDHNLAVE